MKNRTLVIGWVLAASLSASVAGEETAHNISPVLLDTKDEEGTTIGLKFEFTGSRNFTKSKETTAPPSTLAIAGETPPAEIFDLDEKKQPAPYLGFAMNYKIAGTVTAEEEHNPENLVDAFVNLNFKSSRSDAFGTIIGGAILKYETDQAFDNEQFVYGLGVTYGKIGIFAEMDSFSIDVRRGEVDPAEDKARQTALAATSLDPYYRNELEILYNYPIAGTVPVLGKMARSFEFNYRYYGESGAPLAIEQAGLDKFFLRTFRLNLEHDLFVAYSKGKLPFDVKEDDYFTLGFSYDLD
jgi:hypothetical protein